VEVFAFCPMQTDGPGIFQAEMSPMSVTAGYFTWTLIYILSLMQWRSRIVYYVLLTKYCIQCSIGVWRMLY